MRKTVFSSLLLMAFFWHANTYSAQVEISLRSPNNNPLANVVIYLEPTDKSSMPVNAAPKDHSAIMDQIDQQFKPHILVVQKSAWINFPNSDSIKHHVYSFSDAKTFQLKLYSGGSPSPMQFDTTGEVALGCNIHDWMLGYIYVVDTPWFAKTNQQGKVKLDVPAGDYQLKFWSPLLKDTDKDYSEALQVQQDMNKTLTLKADLLPALVEYEDTDNLTGY